MEEQAALSHQTARDLRDAFLKGRKARETALEYFRALSESAEARETRDGAARIAGLCEAMEKTYQELALELGNFQQRMTPMADPETRSFIGRRDRSLCNLADAARETGSEELNQISVQGAAVLQDFAQLRSNRKEFEETWKQEVTQPLREIARSSPTHEAREAASLALSGEDWDRREAEGKPEQAPGQ